MNLFNAISPVFNIQDYEYYGGFYDTRYDLY